MADINLSTFNQGKAFSVTHPLDVNVCSDHAEVKVQFGSIKLGTRNISNGEYHKYFTKGPFEHTHMPCNPDHPWLADKIATQTKYIVDELVNKEVDILVIQEGYFQFYQDLKSQLGDDFQFCSVLNNQNHGYENSNKNITAIIVNTKHLDVLEANVLEEEYESEDDKQVAVKPKIIMPHVKVMDKSSSQQLMCFGVHCPGWSNQFPKKGLMMINEIINREITRVLLENESLTIMPNMIALGDFNTVPDNIRAVTKFKVLPPMYPTHINPRCEVCAYDNVVYNSFDTVVKYFPLESLSMENQSLVESLLRVI